MIGRRAVVTTLAVVVYIAGCVYTDGGLDSSAYPADLTHYHDFAEQIRAGNVPYDDFSLEYPPAAVPVFLAPALIDDGSYLVLFKWAMAATGLVTLLLVAWLLARIQPTALQYGVGVASVAAVPLLMGHVYLNRYDPWAALVTLTAVVMLLVRRARLAGAALAVAFATKVFAAAALPLVALRLWRTGGRRGLRGGVGAFAAVTLGIFGPFLIVAFGGIGFSFYQQATRLLSTESLGGSFLLAADRLGAYDADVVRGLSIDLAGPFPARLALMSSALMFVAVLLPAVAYARGDPGDARFLAAFAASVTGFVVFAKAISPQFLVWLVPLVPLVSGRLGLIAVGLLVATQLVTHPTQHGYEGTTIPTWTVILLVIRSVLLLVLYGVLLRAASAGARALSLRDAAVATRQFLKPA